MGKQDAAIRFRNADDLYRKQRYPEALALLEALDREFPDTKNLMFPLASCLAKLGRLQEAGVLCDRLLTDFNDLRARELKRWIEAQAPPAPADTGLAALNGNPAAELLDLGPPPLPRQVVKPRFELPDWAKPVLIGTGVVLVAALLLLPLFTGGKTAPTKPAPKPARPQQASEQTGVPTVLGPITFTRSGVIVNGYKFTRWGWRVATLPFSIILCTINLFLTLLFVTKFRHDTFWANVFDCFCTSAICAALLLIPCIGIIASIVILGRAYDFVFGDYVKLWGISFGTGLLWLGLFFLPALLNS